jgi:hypothetical protein
MIKIEASSQGDDMTEQHMLRVAPGIEQGRRINTI